VTLYDLAGDREPETRSLTFGFRGEERFCGAGGVVRVDARTIVRNDECHLLPVGTGIYLDPAAGLACFTGIEQQVDEGVLEERAVALNHGQLCRDVQHKRYPAFAKSMVYERDGAAYDTRGVHAREVRCATSRKIEKAPHEELQTLRLVHDDARGVGGTLVGSDTTEELLRAAQDDTKRCRYFVRDAHRERSHDGGPRRAREPLIALVLHSHDGDLALKLELLALIAEGEAAKGKYQPGGDRNAEEEPPRRTNLAVTFAARRRDGSDSPRSESTRVDARKSGVRRSLGKSKRCGFPSGEPSGGEASLEGNAECLDTYGSPVSRTKLGRPRDL
jgi:hypothetical protein